MTFLPDRALAHLRRVVDRPDVVAERYEIVDELGRGGMAVVFLAQDRALDREVALKIEILPPGGNGPEAEDTARRVLREARTIARLEHPGIVPVHDVGTLPDGRFWYAMKRVCGVQLDDHLHTVTGLADRLRLFIRICEPVSFAHAHGVIHRDLKPANIMVGPFGEVLVMDWGVAKVADADREFMSAGNERPPSAENDGAGERARGPTLPGTVVGTPGFMAPEQAAADASAVGVRSDVYALGAVLGVMLEDRGDREERDGPVPRPLAAIRDQALALDPAARYASVEALAEDVRRFLDGEPLAAYRETVLERAARLLVRYRAPLLLIGAYLAMRIAVLLLTGS